MRVLRRVGTSLVAAAMFAGAHAARASSAPEVLLSVGTSFAVNGEPGSGGASAAGGLLWPFEKHYAFGLALYADDQGTGSVVLHDPNTGTDLGTIGSEHRWTYGGEWRAEARLHDATRARLAWGASLGYGRQVVDEFGETQDAVSGVLASTGLTYLYKASHGHAFGATLAYKHQFVHLESDPNRSTTWATASFEWRWQGTPKE
jgi:hypothetical protein